MKNNQSKAWWWNKYLSLEISDKRRDWFDGHHDVAFHWELARRNFPLADYPAFKELKRGEYDIAYFELSKKFSGFKPPAMVHYFPCVKYEPHRVSFPDKLWNLDDSEHALKKAFWQLIEAERRARGIAEPGAGKAGKASRNVGNRARTKGEGPPWRWIELIDDPHQLTSNERSHLSAARKKMHKLKGDFLAIWKQIEEHRQRLALHPENKIDRERIRW